MAEATEYVFSLKEITELLVKDRGIKNGRWNIGFEFDIVVGMFGSNKQDRADVSPGSMTRVRRVILSAAPASIPESAQLPFVVDAAKLQD